MQANKLMVVFVPDASHVTGEQQEQARRDNGARMLRDSVAWLHRIITLRRLMA
jgi:hypothetical protein